MLLIDYRAGSRDLKPYLDQLHIPNDIATLDYGDIAFLGRGPDDGWVQVGIEYKTLDDVLTCITTGRYAGHQLPGMQRTYGNVSWLLIEGIWRANPETGILEVPARKGWQPALRGGGKVRRPMMGRDLDKYLLTITQQSGTRVWKTGMKPDSARWLGALYKWWTDKKWEEHDSLHTFDLSGPSIEIKEPDVVREIAARLPGVGWVKSTRVVQHFGSVLAMTLADEKEWAEIDGIGKTLAKRIVNALHQDGRS